MVVEVTGGEVAGDSNPLPDGMDLDAGRDSGDSDDKFFDVSRRKSSASPNQTFGPDSLFQAFARQKPPRNFHLPSHHSTRARVSSSSSTRSAACATMKATARPTKLRTSTGRGRSLSPTSTLR